MLNERLLILLLTYNLIGYANSNFINNLKN